MRDSSEPLIPLNGCKDKHFPVNCQIFSCFLCYHTVDFSHFRLKSDISCRLFPNSDNRRGFLILLRSKYLLVFLRTLQQTDGLLQLFVVAKACLDSPSLIIVGRDDLRLHDLTKRLLITIQGESHIVAELRLQLIKGRFGIIVIALKLRRLHQLLELLPADRIIRKSALDNTLLTPQIR